MVSLSFEQCSENAAGKAGAEIAAESLAEGTAGAAADALADGAAHGAEDAVADGLDGTIFRTFGGGSLFLRLGVKKEVSTPKGVIRISFFV